MLSSFLDAAGGDRRFRHVQLALHSGSDFVGRPHLFVPGRMCVHVRISLASSGYVCTVSTFKPDFPANHPIIVTASNPAGNRVVKLSSAGDRSTGFCPHGSTTDRQFHWRSHTEALKPLSGGRRSLIGSPSAVGGAQVSSSQIVSSL